MSRNGDRAERAAAERKGRSAAHRTSRKVRVIELAVLLVVIVVAGLVAVPVWRELTAPTPIEQNRRARPELTAPEAAVPARILQPMAGGAPASAVPQAPPAP